MAIGREEGGAHLKRGRQRGAAVSAFWIFFICETSKMLGKDPAHPRGQFTKSPHAFKIKQTPSEVFRLSGVVCVQPHNINS